MTTEEFALTYDLQQALHHLNQDSYVFVTASEDLIKAVTDGAPNGDVIRMARNYERAKTAVEDRRQQAVKALNKYAETRR